MASFQFITRETKICARTQFTVRKTKIYKDLVHHIYLCVFVLHSKDQNNTINEMHLHTRHGQTQESDPDEDKEKRQDVPEL